LVPASRSLVDYHDPFILREFLRSEQIRGVINCAGFTGKPNVDACEDSKELCFKMNVELPETIAKVCFDEKRTLYQIGSGCIYQGNPDAANPDKGYKEEDVPNFSFEHPPCSFYSGTKAEMEKRIKDTPGVSIFRLRMPFSSAKDDRNLLWKLSRYPKLIEASNSLSFLDEFISTSLKMVAAQTPSGIYNFTNPGVAKNSQIVQLLIDKGIRSSEIAFFSSTSETHSVMRAPRSSCILDSTKIAALGFPLSDVHETLLLCISKMRT
jgi:dTDP-4-dehydrorhamnose reductase